jgi:CubicO group peptidase (beta-lactamase class C family)
MRTANRLYGTWILTVVIVLVVASWVTPAGAQQLLSPEARQKIDAVFAAYDRTNSPGCALAIYRNDEILYERGYGMANLEHGVALTPQTVFDIGSTSKQFTAFSILLLERQGKLSLDDDVRKFLSELPQYERPITVRHLMQHTSGLRDYLTLWDLAGMKTESWTTQKDAVQLVVRQKRANFGAGDEWLYSNTGYLLLAEIVERASGSNLRDFARDQIFGPLGMRHTFYLTDHTLIIPHRATGYSPRAGGGFKINMSNFEQVGDGAVQTTVEDLLLWDRNFYAPKVGDAALLEREQTVGKLNNGRELDYAAGLTIGEYRGLRTVRHGGSWAGYRAELLRFPTQKTSVACLCNLATTNPSRLANQVADVVLEKSLKPMEQASQPQKPATAYTPSEKDLSALVGVYRNTSDGHDYRRLFVRNGRLVMAPGGMEMTPLAADRFEMTTSGAQLLIGSTKEGIREISIVPAQPAGMAKPVSFRLLPPMPAMDLMEYEGQYYSEELDTTYTFTAGEGRLTIRLKSESMGIISAASRDIFIDNGGLVVEFQRTNGAVSGARVSSGRVRDLEFNKVAASSRSK